MSLDYGNGKKSRFNLFDNINVLLVSIVLFVSVFPFYYEIIYSLSDPQKAQAGVFLLPAGLTFKVYTTVLKLGNIPSAFLISILRTVLGTALTVFCCSLLAYLITQEEFKLRKVVYRFLVVTMYFNAGLIPWYLLIKAIGFKNNFLLYIIPSALSVFYVILIKTFIEQLPKALEEYAKIDGAGFFTIFSRIIFPISKPIIATVSVFSAVYQWNNWFDTYLFVNNKSLFSAQYVLYTFLRESEALAQSIRDSSRITGIGGAATMTPMSIRMGITIVITLPILFIYPFMQRYFVKGITLGAVKG